LLALLALLDLPMPQLVVPHAILFLSLLIIPGLGTVFPTVLITNLLRSLAVRLTTLSTLVVLSLDLMLLPMVTRLLVTVLRSSFRALINAVDSVLV
jgi:hypothetical protein